MNHVESGAVDDDPAPEPDQSSPSGPGPSPGAVREPVPVTIRRAPRFTRIILLGALVGAIIGLIAVSQRPQGAAADYSLATLLGYFGVIGALLGGLLGGLVAVLLDRRS